MHRRHPRPVLALAGLALALACSGGGGGDESATGASDSAFTATDTTGTSTGDSTTSTAGTSTSGGSATESGTTGTSTDTSTTGVASTAATTDACPPGSEGCPCDGGACAEGLVCTAGTCAPPIACEDAEPEPNDSEATAIDLGTHTDDDADGGAFTGVLAGKADVDWYKYTGNDVVLHTTEPTRDVMFDKAARFCKFLECQSGGAVMTEVTCPLGSDFAISPELRPGCCSGEGFELKDYNCPGQDDSVFVYMRFDKALFDECVAYDVAFYL